MQSANTFPQRIVCLAAEAPEIIDRLGALDRVVGVSTFARRPAAVRRLPKVGGFATPDLVKICNLQPDLVITISDLQADTAAALIRQGIPVLALPARRLADVPRSMLLIGGALGLVEQAEELAAYFMDQLHALAPATLPTERPRVYFEEWPDPLISGIGWVSDLIHLLGGEDIFREFVSQPSAMGRIVQPESIIQRAPHLIVASWCGKKADLPAIAARPGWTALPAVQLGRVHELPSHLILQTGPSLLDGARQLRDLLWCNA
jgi:iron complex transport system substrate-binding protein